MSNTTYIYVWVDYGQGFEPHMTFRRNEIEDARYERDDLKWQGYKARFGEPFPETKSLRSI